MKSEEIKKWSETYAIKRRINMILRSKRLGYWRIVGKDDQKFWIGKMKQYKDDLAMLKVILDSVSMTYHTHIRDMEKMCDKEKKTKLKTMRRYAEGRF